MKIDPKLVERWSGEAGAKLRAAVFARLGARRSKSLEGLPLGTHEGRIDLRGIWSDRPEVARRSEIAGMQAEMAPLEVSFRGLWVSSARQR